MYNCLASSDMAANYCFLTAILASTSRQMINCLFIFVLMLSFGNYSNAWGIGGSACTKPKKAYPPMPGHSF